NFDHVRTTQLAPGVYQMAWEDKPNGGDQDFNDLIAVVRVDGDQDGDGLWDDWEANGIDGDGDGQVDILLPGADPRHKDIYVWIDYMSCPGGDCGTGDAHSHLPKQAARDAVIAAFANAPVSNPDGTTGINLHLEVHNAVTHQNLTIIPNSCGNGAPPAG